MNVLRSLLLMSLACMTSAFVNVIGGIQLRNSRVSIAPAIKMCNVNATDLFEKFKGSRRDLGKAIFATTLSSAFITVEAFSEKTAAYAEQDHSWTQHNGAFSEDEIKDFVQTKSGLLYKDIEKGQGSPSKDGELVTLEMVGYIFETGDKWCNTYKGIPTYKSVIRAGIRENQKFMKGLNEGVLQMKKRAKRILVIPAYLAYNYVAIYSQNDPSQIIIPGGAALVCYIEVVDIKPQ